MHKILITGAMLSTALLFHAKLMAGDLNVSATADKELAKSEVSQTQLPMSISC